MTVADQVQREQVHGGSVGHPAVGDHLVGRANSSPLVNRPELAGRLERLAFGGAPGPAQVALDDAERALQLGLGEEAGAGVLQLQDELAVGVAVVVEEEQRGLAVGDELVDPDVVAQRLPLARQVAVERQGGVQQPVGALAPSTKPVTVPIRPATDRTRTLI